MTPFQWSALGLFIAALVVAYRTTLLAGLTNVLALVRRAVPVIGSSAPARPSAKAAQNELVHDLVVISDLRDRLTAKNCKEGADACTLLLRVMIEAK